MQLWEQFTVYTLFHILRERLQPASDFRRAAKSLLFFSMKNGRPTPVCKVYLVFTPRGFRRQPWQYTLRFHSETDTRSTLQLQDTMAKLMCSGMIKTEISYRLCFMRWAEDIYSHPLKVGMASSYLELHATQNKSLCKVRQLPSPPPLVLSVSRFFFTKISESFKLFTTAIAFLSFDLLSAPYSLSSRPFFYVSHETLPKVAPPLLSTSHVILFSVSFM